jgi:hypothetical protein
MAYRPLMDGKEASNAYDEHVFKIRCTFGASSAVTYRSKDATIAKTTTTTFTVTLPQPYAEIISFKQGWYKPTGADSLLLQITTNSVATDGTLVLTSVSTNSAGTATAPASGDVVYIELGVSDHSLNDAFTG